jgi:hypothetical protein
LILGFAIIRVGCARTATAAATSSVPPRRSPREALADQRSLGRDRVLGVGGHGGGAPPQVESDSVVDGNKIHHPDRHARALDWPQEITVWGRDTMHYSIFVKNAAGVPLWRATASSPVHRG